MAADVPTDVPGKVWKVLAEPGDGVKTGDVRFILELTKTQVPHPRALRRHG
jgi:biotin carboxyl carrier protein